MRWLFFMVKFIFFGYNEFISDLGGTNEKKEEP